MPRTDEIMLRLWPVPESCAQVRHAVRKLCADTPLADLGDDAELIASEIVTNAITHAATLITMVAVVRSGELVVTVSDDVAALPVAGSARDHDENGRGMVVVDSLAGAWGVTPRPIGKTVWFRLP
ncbi:MAG TPA: ATP-binding protein [Mycobacteriales bacterium]|jgi:anti-sigma regulatory factor (Ser/Thr protein kinase)|nr:ATP-binding protein [Mycobacteriales bacterium]